MTERTYVEELITPELAGQYLTKNTGNRGVKDRRVRLYTQQMADGQWRPTGESIKFSKSGRLIDGQNRLLAVIAADVPVVMLVARGLEDVAQESMDTGATRSLADVLKMRGETSGSNLAAVIRALYIWDHSDPSTTRRVGLSGQSWSVSNAQLLAYFDENADGVRGLHLKCETYRRSLKIPSSVLAPLVREMQDLDYEDADDFMRRWCKGVPSAQNFGERDPLVQLNQAANRLKSSRGDYDKTEMAAYVVKAWNAYRTGIPIHSLRFRTGGSSPESFPEFK